MDTFELLPSLAQGELGSTSAPELVAAVFRSRASGTLWVETPEGAETRIYFRAGNMCGAAAFEGFRTLAHMLLANDWVDALDIDSSREEAAATGQRHGAVLVARGLLTQDQLRAALAAQHRQNLGTVLSLSQGKYDWRGWEPPPQWAREVFIDPMGCIVDALEQEQHAARVERVMQWLGGGAVRLSVEWPELQGRVSLEPLDRRAAALLALPRRFEELVQASRLPERRAAALLVGLLLAGGVEPQPRSSAPPPATLEPIPEPQQELAQDRSRFASSGSNLSLESETELPVAVIAADAGDVEPPQRRMVNEEEAFARLDSLTADDLSVSGEQGGPLETQELELDRTTPAAGARAGGEAHLDGSPDDPLPGLETPAEHVLGRSDEGASHDLRKRMLVRGLRNLSGQPSRPPDQSAAPAARQEDAPLGTLDESRLSPEDQRFVDEVRSRATLAPRQTAYARLGVNPQASAEAIKAAYLQAAKRYHPDRAGSQPALAALQPELQAVFGALKDAYDALATPEQRAHYDESLKAGSAGKPTSRHEEAATALKMGEVLLRKRDFDGAIQKLRRAADLEPTGDTLAALAWALMSDPKHATKEEAASLINRALRAPGATARTFYVAGVVWRTKDPESAVDAFRKTLELDPGHADASLELRLLESRRKGGKPAGGGVLSGLLFGKRKNS